MRSTMMDAPLSIHSLFRHGASIHKRSHASSFNGATMRRSPFGQVAERTLRIAAALRRAGVAPGDRVATFSWNRQEHLELFFAVPMIGAVLHPLNLRLHEDQLAYIVEHAGDSVVIVDPTLVPMLAPVLAKVKCVRLAIVMEDAPADLGVETAGYEQLLSAETATDDFPEVDERAAASMCYTSGTTGNPKGVVYSHRSTYLHAMALTMADSFAIQNRDRVLIVPPMFHCCAWGLPYACWMAGADMVLPGRFVQAEPLSRLLTEERITFCGAVPAIWNEALRFAQQRGVKFDSLRLAFSAGSAVPRALQDRFQQEHGVTLLQGWGMTETSPICAVSFPPKDAAPGTEPDYLARTGRVIPGVELRLCDGDTVVATDGHSIGEIEVRGPWITGTYFGDEGADKFHDGWLKTGDVGTIDDESFFQISDRSKDVIKSGGEWISSVELENHLMAHPDVVEAAVVGVPDERWDERPLACVVIRSGSAVTLEELRQFLAGRVAKWWLPERWSVIDEVPKTSVGKFDKKRLRARAAAQELAVVDVTQKEKPATV